LVVTGHEAEKTRGALAGAGVTFVSNAQYEKGLSTSVKAGINSVPVDCDGAMILLGDMPDISAKLIDRVIASFDPAAGHAICAASAGGRRGHPVLWARSYFPQLTALKGDAGARALLEAHSDQLVEIEAGDEAPLTDIDTPEALLACRQR
jgi:molybdenum cofactor cytidylyltransferase